MALHGLGQPNGTAKVVPESPKHTNGHANGGLPHAEPDMTGEIVVFEVDDESLHNVRSKPKILQDSLVRSALRNLALILIWCAAWLTGAGHMYSPPPFRQVLFQHAAQRV